MTRTSIIVLALLLTCAVGVRAIGITYGLPFSQSEKEQRNVNTALKMAATKDLNPHQIGKGLIWYILLAEFSVYYVLGRAVGRFDSPFDFAKDFFLDHTELYLIDRINQIALALLSLWFLFRLCRRLFGDRGGLWALAFGAFSAVHVEISHHASEDMLVVLFSVLTMDRAVRYQESKTMKDLVLAGLFAAMTASAKITGGIALMSILPVVLWNKEWKRACILCFLFAVFYILANPYVFAEAKLSLASLARDAELRSSAVERQGIGTTLRVIGGQMLGYPLALLALIGMAAPTPVRRTVWLIAVAPVLFFMATLGHGWGIGPLYAMVIWPMLMTAGAAGVAFLHDRAGLGIGPVLGVLGILSPVFWLHSYTPLMEQVKTYASAEAPAHEMVVWIRKNLPRDESIAVMSGDVWKGRLFLTPDRIRERLERFKKPAEYAGLEYNLGNVHFYEFMLKVVESDASAPCFNMRYLSGKTRSEMEQEPRRQAIYRIEDVLPYEQWKEIAGLPENYFLFVGGMDLPAGREIEIKYELERAGTPVMAFPPFVLYSLRKK